MANPTKVYWDSNAYLDYLRGDHHLLPVMQMVIDDWREGKVTIVTSALTIAEVLWWRTDTHPVRERISREKEMELRELFNPPRNQKLTIVEVSRKIGEAARELVWNSSIKPKDAIHVASALEAKCPVMHTSDKDLVAMSGKVGHPPLAITFPDWTRQGVLESVLDDAGRI